MDFRRAHAVRVGDRLVEATTSARSTSRARPDVVSLRRGRLRGVHLHEPAGRVRVDRTLQEARSADYDALFVPGGFIGPDLLRQSADARAFAAAFDAERKPIAT